MARHDEELLRRFVACRDAGDWDAAQRWWQELVELNFDRVRDLVALRARGRLSPDERDEAFALALEKLWRNMPRTFAGSSVGEFVNATRTLVDYACLDVQRRAARRSRRETSLDAPGRAGEDDVRRAQDLRIAAVATELHERAGERAAAAEFVAWALPRLHDERRRLVLERTLEGMQATAIAGELGVSVGNVYQLRSRGLRELVTLHAEFGDA